MTPGARLRAATDTETPLLQCVGVSTAYHALLAQRSGIPALYVSGSGVAASSCGLPDLGVTTMEDVLIDVRRITEVTDLPVLVDIDTGWGGPLNIGRAVRSMERATAAGIHIEDQVFEKRCGHRPGKAIVSCQEMLDRIKAAVDARIDPDFVVMARTDALATEGMQAAVERITAYVEAGADMVFPEALHSLDQYRCVADAIDVPILANVTEFGNTPLFVADELASAGVRIALYPLSAFRAASQAALEVYQAIRDHGSQRSLVERMQTREQLYDVLDYHRWERQIDQRRSQTGDDDHGG